MSQIPRAGGSRPLIKTTSTVSSRTASGGTKTTTTTNIRELQPCTSAGQSICPPGQRSIRPPSGASGIRAPRQFGPPLGPPQAQSTMMQSRIASTSRAGQPSRQGRAPPRAPAPGEYNVPAQFGPMSRAGKGMTYSSPAALRGQMEARVPKDIRYGGVKTCPYTGEKQRGALQGSRMADTLAGSFNVYGGQSMRSEQMVDRSVLDERVKDKYPEDFRIKDYKFLGKTENYQQFLCTKKQFGMRWILHYDIMRQFLKECVVGLPYVLFKLDIQNVLEIDELRYIFREKVHTSVAVLHDFHKTVYTLLDKSDGAGVFKKRPSKVLSACTGLFSIYVSRSIAHTLESIVTFTESIDISPYIKLYVDFESSLVLTPTQEHVIEMYHKLLDDIINVGKELNVMEKGRIRGYESKKMCLCLTEEFVRKCKNDITDNIAKLYEPILRYLGKFGSDFAEIYSDISSDNVFHNGDILFDEGCQKIQYYKKFIHNVAYVPDKEYFRIGHLDLTSYRGKLHDRLQMVSDSFFKNLSSQHLWEVNDICDSFQLIKVRATQKPLTTEELIEIGKFMSWVKNEQLEELNERVHASLMSLCNIITLGILDEDHMKMNSAAMNWIEDILPIIEQHSIIYEQLKFEAEDKLQKVIEDINVLVTDAYPLLVILDDMDDIKSARNYLSKITLHMAKIKVNQQTAEQLFNMSSPEVSMVEEQAAHELLEKSMLDPEDRVYSRSQYVQQIDNQQMLQTPAGMEPVVQMTYSERRVERDDIAEKIVKNLAVTDMDECSGKGTRITISEQQLDADYGLSSEAKDTVTMKETVSMTPLYTSTVKEVHHEVVKPKLNIDPGELAQMVDEENQDVENTLKIVPPDLAMQEDRYSTKKRLQKLRLNTESMILLEESVVNPTPTADHAMPETPPEALANIMHTIEGGVTPECPPDQVFHTLFAEKVTEQSVILSSFGPGPLQDVIVPQVLGKEVHKESMTPDLIDLTNIYKNVTDAKDWPPVDIFASVMDEGAKSPHKELKSRPFKPLQDEETPWAEEDLELLVNIVGAEPAAVLDPANVPDLEMSGNLETELSHGIEYFVDADPVQYMSRVQLRGTQPPPCFPGYIFALPEFPDIVKLARNPDEVFVSSWRSCQPKIIADNSISILH